MADYTSLEHDEVVALGRQLGVRVSSLRRLEGGMRNSSFALGTDIGPLVLSVLDSHDLASARALADMTAGLAAAGVPTPAPLASPGRGRVLVTRAGTPVMVRPYVEGRVFVTVPGRELDAAGRLLARIHTLDAPVRLPPPRRRLPEGWRDRLRGCADARLVELAGRAEAIGRHGRWERLPQGSTHGDLFNDNLVRANDGWHVIDWEHAARDSLVLDVAIALVGVCRTGTTLPASRVERFLAGYEQVRALHSAERSALDDALRYGIAVLAYERWVRHNVDRPDPSQAASHRELVHLVDALDARRQ